MSDTDRIIEDLEMIAAERGWKLNPDISTVNTILKGQNMLNAKFGAFYCPCKKQKIPENICPCADSQREINEQGHCHCNLFYPA